jgi:hypothetical protein
MSVPSSYLVAFFPPRSNHGRTVASFRTNEAAESFARKKNAELGRPTTTPFAIYAVLRPGNGNLGKPVVDTKLDDIPRVVMMGRGCKVTPRKGLV